MSKAILKYVSTDFGCTIRTGSVSQIRSRIGTDNVREIRLATEKDVAYVKHMGGFVPDGRISKVTP